MLKIAFVERKFCLKYEIIGSITMFASMWRPKPGVSMNCKLYLSSCESRFVDVEIWTIDASSLRGVRSFARIYGREDTLETKDDYNEN